VQDQPIGGWGINLIKSLTDEIRYDYEDNKNKLTLIKRKKITSAGTMD
jgi:anti-sigma regulatory factor (Ser/Thr protein kinase)